MEQKATIAALAPAVPPPLDGTLGGAWSSASRVTLGWDLPNGRPAREATDVYVLVDAHTMYVAFKAVQHDPIVAAQRANNIGEGSDDEVHVTIWPAGNNGFRYDFVSTPLGTRYQYSTENDAYTPRWIAGAHITDGGYTVTMAIPLDAMRIDPKAAWSLQLWRTEAKSGEQYVWSHAPGQTSPHDSSYAGRFTGISALVKTKIPKPRIGVYALGQAASPNGGGDTSRLGADAAIPFTPTASALVTIHPDYSNVEIDQQTIAPTAFARTYAEVRPFFNQGSNLYQNTSCYGCPGIQPLYTPGIPTPKRGFAVEGVQGPLSFGTYSAIGDGRSDQASGLSLQTNDHRFSLSETSTWANIAASDVTAAVHDTASTFTAYYNDHSHVQGYVDYGFDRGTNVLDAARAQYEDAGIAWYTKDDFDAITMRKVGAYFQPADGYIQLADIAGYSGQINHTWRFAARSALSELDLNLFVDNYQSTSNGTNLFDVNENLYAVFKNHLDMGVGAGGSGAAVPGDVLRPYNQDGLRIDYDRNKPTQDTLLFGTGRYAGGYLNAWTRIGAIPITKQAVVTLEADDTDWTGGRLTLQQWLERASLGWTINSDTTFSVGARKIIGAPPPSGPAPPTATATAVNQTNVSFSLAVHRKWNELYVAYGDPNQVTTLPAFIVKFIYYFGAQKGT